MTTNASTSVSPRVRGRALNTTLWTVQALVGAFFAFASAAPKLFGQAYAVEIFDQIGSGQWLRYVVGLLELAGAIGLVIPRLAGLAALGLTALLVGATYTQVVVLDSPATAFTPVVLGIVTGLIAWGRWSSVRALFARR